MVIFLTDHYEILPARICAMTYFICISRGLIWARGQQLIDLRLLAGLFFPSLQPEVAEVEPTLSSAFSVLRLAEQADEEDADKASEALRTSTEVAATRFKTLGAPVLAAGRVENIGNFTGMLLHPKRRGDARAILSNA